MTMTTNLEIGGLTLNLLQEGSRFLGVGAVSHDGMPLRSGALPWTFYTESDEGFRFDEFTGLRVLTRKGGAVELRFQSAGRWMPRAQEADAMGDSRIRARRLKAPVASFRWTLRPVAERIAENEWAGVAMQLEVRSPACPLHWVIEEATWELGGRASGATLIQQDVSTMDLEQTVKRGGTFSTIEKFFTDDRGSAYPMDMMPRAAGAAICDFQTKGDRAICLFSEQPGLTRARIEKFSDEEVIHYTDRPFLARSTQLVFPERKLLVYRNPAPLERHEWRNLWLDCFTEVRSRILGHYDFKPEIPRPMIHAHLWDKELKQLGAAWTEALAEAMPLYARLGYRHLFTHGVWNSVTSDDDPSAKGNICCPYDYAFAEKFGGPAGMRRLREAARRSGLGVFQWFSFQLSNRSPVWKTHPDWLVHQANGTPWNASYSELWAGKMTTAYGDWIQRQVLAIQENTGIDGAFWDSYQNLGVTCIDWSSDDKTPQADAIWRLQSLMQKKGFRQTCEVVTIFGVSQVALFGFESDKFRRRLWSDTVRDDSAFVLLDTSPAFMTAGAPPLSRDKISPSHYFWLLGHRAVPAASARPWEPDVRLPGGELSEEFARVNRLYNTVVDQMKRLRLTKGGAYTLWLDARNRPSIVWAFQNTSMLFSGRYCDHETGEKSVADGVLHLISGHVYQLFPKPDPTGRTSGSKRVVKRKEAGARK